MSPSNLKQIIQLLKSDKSKDRQQALVQLRETFSKNDVVEQIDLKKDGRPWLVIFQSLFEAVISEKKTASRKGASVSASEQRLKEAASTIRWLTDKSIAFWNFKVVQAVIKQLMQAMKNHSVLCIPVALDCVKALRTICSYGPHLDHIMMEEDVWIGILSLSFAVVLGDDLGTRLDNESGAFDSSDGEVSVLTNDDDSSSGRKRKRGDAGERKVPTKRQTKTTSPEQIEFVAIITLILQSRRVGLLSAGERRLAPVIVSRLTKFFDMYQSETSAHLDAVAAVQAIFDTLVLNARELTTKFAVSIWDSILRLWSSTKSRPLKEGLLLIVKEIFPFVALEGSGLDKLSSFNRLLQLLQNDVVGSRAMFVVIDMKSIRLEIQEGECDEPFQYHTFRSGYTLASSQVVNWCVVELLADVTFELHLLVESNHSSPAKSTLSERKKSRIEDPIRSCLRNLRLPKADRKATVLSLQVMLFLAERHWPSLHPETRQDIVESLSGAVTTDDAINQSWIFCLLAAIVYADSRREGSELSGAQLDNLWSHSMRRTNVPLVCRSACHLAHTLIRYAKLPLPRIHAEIDAMALDITVQGPSMPHDAVCQFLARCIQIASQDARLYQLRLDDKVLGWLMENWSRFDVIFRSAKHAQESHDKHLVQDILLLLQNACGLSVTGSELVLALHLPLHPLVDLERKRIGTRTIHEYLLHSHIPSKTASHTPHFHSIPTQTSDLAEPNARTRKVSTFLLKSIEAATSLLDEASENPSQIPSSAVVRTFNLALITFFFENDLVLNGIGSNKRTLVAALKLVKVLAPYLRSVPWTHEELVEILASFRVLLGVDVDRTRLLTWEAVVGAGKRTGIRGVSQPNGAGAEFRRNALLAELWQCAEFQEGFEAIIVVVKRVLRDLTSDPATTLSSEFGSQPVDGHDDFGPVRAANTPILDVSIGDKGVTQTLITMCVDVLASLSHLRLQTGDSLRDDFLLNTVIECDDDSILQDVLDPLVSHIQCRALRLSSANLESILVRLEGPLRSYVHGSSDTFHVLTVRLLHATVPIWLDCSSDVADMIKGVYEWLTGALEEGKLHWWRTRDSLRRLCSAYLSTDPLQVFMGTENPERSPQHVLLHLIDDEDVRVRFGGAVATGQVFSSDYMRTRDSMEVYAEVQARLCTVLENYEHMLTRFLYLVNIIVASSEVRRGPYWHLIETCLHTHVYVKQIAAALEIASKQMGLDHFRRLFEAYATQIAYSIRVSGRDFFRLPPGLLGYQDRKECAESTFEYFAPNNISDDQDVKDIMSARGLFVQHCAMINVSTMDGLRRCFSSISASVIVGRVDEYSKGSGEDTVIAMDVDDASVLDTVCRRFEILGQRKIIKELLAGHVDGIILHILRMCGDMDVRVDGPISVTLAATSKPKASLEAFAVMTQYEALAVNERHMPNLPAYSTLTILHALDWLSNEVDSTFSPAATYHVLQQLFSDIHSCVVINEQVRLLVSLALWVALNESHFDHSTLLRVLIGGAAVCLEQVELSLFAQGILEWAFTRIRDLGHKAPHLSEALLRCAATAYRFSSSTVGSIRDLGIQMSPWIEQHTVSLWKSECLRDQVVMALDAWPDECTEALIALRLKTTSATSFPFTAQPSSSRYRFQAIRNIRRVSGDPPITDDFAKNGFWRLKESIPVGELSTEEIDAFAHLLLANSGHIRGRVTEEREKKTIAIRHLHYARARSDYAVKKSIIHSLLDTVTTGPDSKAVNLAYRALRCLSGNEALRSPTFGTWTSDLRGDIAFLDFCPDLDLKECSATIADVLLPQNFEISANFGAWIRRLSVVLCSVLATHDRFFAQIVDVLHSSVDFSEHALPSIVYCILVRSKQVNDNEPREMLSTYFTNLISGDGVDMRCHRSVVSLVTHLRHFDIPGTNNPLGYDRWLDINFSLLSRSAIACGAYTTALLFLELAAEYAQLGRAECVATEETMFEIYSHIDESDGFYGIKSDDMQNTLLRRFRHEHQWDKAFQFHGAQSEVASDSRGSKGIVDSLHAFGFHRLAMSTLQSSSDQSPHESSELMYQLGWRTGSWDLPDARSSGVPNASLYSALRAVHRDLDAQSATTIVSRSMNSEIQRLRELGDENLFEIRQATQNLMCLAQIRRWIDGSLASKIVGGSDVEKMHIREFFEVKANFNFSDNESLVATRMSLLQAARKMDAREQIGTALSQESQRLMYYERSCLIQLSKAARIAGQSQIALNSVIRLTALDKSSSFDAQRELSHVLWLQREQKAAVACMQKEIRKRKPQVDKGGGAFDKVQLSLALAQLGEWSTEACLEKAKSIGDEYFAPAAALLASTAEYPAIDDSRSEVFYKYAIFSEKQYHEIMGSDDVRRLKVYQSLKSEEIAERQRQLKAAKEDHQRRTLANQQDKAIKLQHQDTAQLEDFEKSRQGYLNQAIKMFANCLEASDSFNADATIRFCSLWFANFDGNVSVVDKMANIIPSWKFVFLAHQLSARMTAEDEKPGSSQSILQSLLYRMCSEHPFHSLYQVYLLQSSYSPSSRRQSTRLQSEESQMDRAAAASTLFDRLLTTNNSQKAMDVKYLCDAYLQWAKLPIKDNPAFPSKKKGGFEIPSKLEIRKVSDVKVPVATSHLPLDPTMRYEDCVWITGYAEKFETAGGVNVPKICICMGSDGNDYKQLFKGEGNDDLRQDAVMEQVFELCNQVLSKDQETKRRDLGIRTYKVIPLAAQAGLLEFVGKTKPLYWLAEAHSHYNKNEPSYQAVALELRRARAECTNQHKLRPEDIESLLTKKFKALRSRFKPVMRHFFTEHRKDPQAWFEMRLHYSRSVAVTSIVGHILGLGDRHLSNILIDTSTGEVVHIDLGIAFEQGKLLQVPERVPFRLTADMIDGFGTSGTEGVFRRCAEETLRVLREGSGVIKTVLEVFKYDPLHSWTASAVKIRKAQGPDANANAPPPSSFASVSSTSSAAGGFNTNNLGRGLGFGMGLGLGPNNLDMPLSSEGEAADRALTSVTRKLDKSLSVEYTVNELTNEASDVSNLAMMFPGWSPHC